MAGHWPAFKIGIRINTSLFNAFYVLELLVMLFAPDTIAEILI